MSDFTIQAPSDGVTASEVQAYLNDFIAASQGSSEDYTGFLNSSDGTQIWVLLAGFLVFFMHAGFSMLEAGSVRHKNVVNILFKNIGTLAFGGVCYFLTGYAFAYGTANEGKNSHRFIGSGNFALSEETNATRHSWFFQFAFAATAATIVSGAVAGRINLIGYFICACFLTLFVYPVVSHWIWATGGWASAFTPKEDVVFGPDGCGMLDYAGSGVVHLTGGIAAFWGALIVGPRQGRFDADGNSTPIPPHNISMQALGVFILWFGWYGFNCGSTLAFDGNNASKVAVTTTLSASMAVVTGIISSHFIVGHFDIGISLNCALAGLVSITAGCSTVQDWAAIIIGFIGAFVYIGASKLMVKIKLDDPVDAIAVHGFCGIWGCLATGIFATPENIANAYSGRECSGWNTGLQFGTQLVGILAILGWVTLMMVPFFFGLKAVNMLRVPPEFEENGLDFSEHGGTKAFIGEVVKTEQTAKVLESDGVTEQTEAPKEAEEGEKSLSEV